MPAKSGVAGGIFAVLPGQLAVSVFSPRLDAHGNSVRGVAVCRALAEELQLHSLRVARSARSTIRASHDVAAIPSRRRRPRAQVEALASIGHRAVVYELQGDLLFTGTERVVRAIVDSAADLDVVVLDLCPVDRIEAPAALMVQRLRDELLAAGKELGFVTTNGRADIDAAAPRFTEADEAREWCEERLLARVGLQAAGHGGIELCDHGLCRGLDDASIAELQTALSERRFAAGDTIVATGDSATEIFLVLAGEVGVYLPLQDGRRRRLVALGPGATFGELAVLGQSTRTADVMAESDVTLVILAAETFERLSDTSALLKVRLLQNMLAIAYETVARLSREVTALACER
jgi:glutaminase